MKRTFPTIRKKVRNKFPYLLKDRSGNIHYLFEVDKNTSLSKIIQIEKSFNDDELVFATTIENFSNSIISVDASNAYEVGERKTRPFLYFVNGQFFETEIKTLTDPLGKEYKRVFPTGRKSSFSFVN